MTTTSRLLQAHMIKRDIPFTGVQMLKSFSVCFSVWYLELKKLLNAPCSVHFTHICYIHLEIETRASQSVIEIVLKL